MTLTRIDTHVEDGIDLLIDQYRDKPRIEALLTSYLTPCQKLENTFWDILEKRALDVATDAQLDTLGRLVGQPRIGATDDDYRAFIRTRIRANRSRGKSVDVIEVAILATGGDQRAIRYIEIYPATFIIDLVYYIDTLGISAQFLHDIIEAAKPAGVDFALHFSQFEEDDGTFAFADGVFPVEDTARGLSDVLGLIGGTLIGVI